MTWIFPMAGKGERLKELGDFKPFILIENQTIFTWLIESIKDNIGKEDRLVAVTTMDFADRFEVRAGIKQSLEASNLTNEFELVTCKETPPGPAASVYQARDHVAPGEEVIVVNSDQYIDFKMIDLKPRTGFLPVYRETSGKSSYVKIEKGKITRIAEKERISDTASAGVYALADAASLFGAIEKLMKDKKSYKDEYFVGPALNYLIEEGYVFYPVEVAAKYDLGKVDGIEAFREKVRSR